MSELKPTKPHSAAQKRPDSNVVPPAELRGKGSPANLMASSPAPEDLRASIDQYASTPLQMQAQSNPAELSRATFLSAIPTALAAFASVLAAPSVGNLNMSFPGAVQTGEERFAIILSGITGRPGDGSYTGLAWNHTGYTVGSNTITLGSWKNDVLQVGWDGAAGKFISGAGAVTQDVDGITLKTGTGTANKLKWRTAVTPYDSAYIYGSDDGTTPNREGSLDIVATGEPGGSGRGIIRLNAFKPSVSGGVKITLNSEPSSGKQFYAEDVFGNTGSLHYGDYSGYASVVAASTTPTSGYSRVVKDDSMGANGFFEYDAWFLVSNTGATNVLCTFDVSFGGTTILSKQSTGTGASTPRYNTFRITGIVANTNNAALQRCIADVLERGTAQDSTTSATNNSLDNFKTASVNTGTGDRTFDITCTLSTATNSKVERLGVNFFGPYYAA